MLPGPVFWLEMTTVSRGLSGYARRSAYGLALVALLGAFYHSAFGGLTEVQPVVPARFARLLFDILILTQAIAIVSLTPALASGAIAGEIQRKTLHDILTTDLTSAEIVVGKAAARFCQIVVLVLAGFPIFLLVGEVAGLGLGGVVVAELATLTTAYFLSGLSLLCSTQTRSLRGALNATMTLSLAWLILPVSFDRLVPTMGEAGANVYRWLAPVNAWIAPTTPFGLWLNVARGAIQTERDLLERLTAMAGLQVVYGSVLIALASALLRPTYQLREGGSRRKSRRAAASSSVEGGQRVACGDDPMIWKELIRPRGPAFQKPLGVAIALMLGGLLLWATLDYAWPAFLEVIAEGYGVAPSGSSRSRFHFYLRIVATGIYLVYALGVASDSASGLTLEHENDTWISLISTPLTGREILRGKILGAIHAIRHTAFTLLALVALGVLAGAVHPIALVFVTLELLAFTTFAGALGAWISLRNTRSLRAVAMVTALGLICNVGYLIAAAPFAPKNPLVYFGCTPLVFAASIVSHADVAGVASFGFVNGISDKALGEAWSTNHGLMFLSLSMSIVFYGTAGWWIYRKACRSFDAHLDRPALEDASGRPSQSSGEREPALALGMRPRATSRRFGLRARRNSTHRNLETPSS